MLISIRRTLQASAVALACGIFFTGLGGSCFAQDTATPDKKKVLNSEALPAKGVGTSAIDQATMGIQLAMLAETSQSPLMVLAAAELIGPLTQSTREVEPNAKEKSGGSGETEKTPLDISFKGLLDRALELAKGDETIMSLVAARVEAMRSGKGLVVRQGKDKKSVKLAGTTFKVLDLDVIGADEGFTYKKYYFEAGLPAKVVVIGDEDGDIDLWVYDANTGGLIGKDTDRTSRCVVSWQPRYEGPFTIKVKNVGAIAERYTLLANW